MYALVNFYLSLNCLLLDLNVSIIIIIVFLLPEFG